ncbi:hypothetical protein OAS89_05170 [Alphaproteobacteria bacterium]|jgi:hypothetical protein|nr:hypothetical protein [Alphaproteobacteria bacterium]
MWHKFILFLPIFAVLNSEISFAKINDERVYNNIVGGCLETASKDFSRSQRNAYCGCVAKSVVDQFTVSELLLIERKIETLKTDEEKINFAVANNKIWKIFSSCAESLTN